MLARREYKTSCTKGWRNLYQEFGLGRLVDNDTLHWSREDIKQWQSLVDADLPAYKAVQDGANRTEVSLHTANDKLTKISIQDKRLFCNAINAPLYLTSGEQTVCSDIEYRSHYQTIEIDRYNACLIIENQESFIYCHRFNWPSLPETLVLYRGHNKEAKVFQSLLDRRKGSMGVYIFPDTDPAGLSIAMSTTAATHIITPEVRTLNSKAILRNRFSTQLQKYPNLQSQANSFGQQFQELVSDVLQTGTAVSQEWLCAHRVPLKLVALRDTEFT